MSKITYNEIFEAPQGEGLWAGMPMVFVRMQGCNLRCIFCDTNEAIARIGGMEMTAAGLVNSLLAAYGDNRVVCFTGGEPLLQRSGVLYVANELHEHGWKVHVETNGTIKLLPEQAQYFDWITVSPKGPNWNMCLPGDVVSEVKFVMPPEDAFWADLDANRWATHDIVHDIMDLCPNAFLWFQPRDNEPKAVEWCLKLISAYYAIYDSEALTVGLSVQVHKYIGSK